MKRTLLLTMVACAGATAIFAAPFTPGNLVIYRIGDGTAALTSAATPVFLDEFTTGGTLVQSVPMPQVVIGSNRILTGTGNATSEGLLTLSTDGRFLVLTGYNAVVGTANPSSTTSTAVNRVVGRVDASANVNTTTALTDAYSGGTPRGAASTDGTLLWISGTGTSGTGSRFTTLGSTTSARLSTTVTNLRASSIFAGQLYVSSGTDTFRLGTVGTGTPTTTGQTITSLPGFPVAAGGNPMSPFQFFFADLDPGVSGVDTVYVADESSVVNGGGVQKYSLVGGTWVANGIVALGTSARGLTGVVNGTHVTLYLTAANNTSTSSSLQTLTDTSGYNATINGTLATLVPAPTNTVFRGIAFAPSLGAVPQLASAVSRLTHGGVGDFDVSLPLTGTAGVEDRSSGTYNIVLTFNNGPVTSGTASVTAGTGTAGAPAFSGNTMTVPLTGVSNAQTLTLTVNNVSGAGEGTLPSASVNIGFLIGDTGNNGSVNSADVGQTKAQSGNAVTASNFREDVNIDGNINASDVGLVKSRSGTSIP